METKWLKVDPYNIDSNVIEEGAKLLREGCLVAFPTETVYGLGANAFDPEACGKIFAVKGRPQDNPLIVHVSGLEMVDRVVSRWNEKAEICAQAFWPGPLTLVLPKSELISDRVSAGLDTVAIRMPDHPVALSLIREAGVPVAAPSANLSGKPSPTSGEHVWGDLKGKIPMIIDGGPCKVGLESTVLDLSGDKPLILRPGGVTKEKLEQVIGNVEVEALEVERPRSPGMKYKHYAPQAQMILYIGERKNIAAHMGDKILKAREKGVKVGVLCSKESQVELARFGPHVLLTLGSEKRPEEFAASLYENLRRCDQEGVELILAEGIKEHGLGTAVMNRMVKAAGHKVIKV